MPNSYGGCCTGPPGLCNGPHSTNNGVPIDMVDALCNALGYQTGMILREGADNDCPQVHVLDASDFQSDAAYGSEYQCTTFK